MLVSLFFHGSYVLAHIYLFLKIRGLFLTDTISTVITGTVIFLLMSAPVFIYLSLLRGRTKISRAFALAGYTWMGLLILFFFPSVIMDLYNILIRLGGHLSGTDMDSLLLPPLHAFSVPVIFSIALTSHGFLAARSLRTKRITVKTSKLPAGTGKISIAHLSDVHLGIIVRDRMLDKLVRIIDEEKPDLIVSTGDLIDGGIQHILYLGDKLKTLTARLGKFAVIGNHEFYTGIKKSARFLEDSGFTVLRGRSVNVNGSISIAGVDDSEGRPDREFENPPSEEAVLREIPRDRFTLLLKHKPEINDASLGLFDLQLSGHTHGGQIFPINIAVRLFFYPHSSFKRLSRDSAINVSGGIGTAGPPVRLFTPPEVVFIDVVPALPE
jgi:predicted MPP superfamily phosphohydrolase